MDVISALSSLMTFGIIIGPVCVDVRVPSPWPCTRIQGWTSHAGHSLWVFGHDSVASSGLEQTM